jgi:hypothetical protein
MVDHNEAMSVPADSGETIAAVSSRPAYLYSVVALGLGVVLGIAATKLFALLGWGGDVASQTAGAVSGAAPLILDGLLRRRADRSRARPALTRDLGYQSRLFIASAYGFALLVIDSGGSLLMLSVTRWAVRLAHGDQARMMTVFGLLGTVIMLPVLLIATYLLAVAGGHRIGDRYRRWILLGMAVYTAMRIATVMASSQSAEEFNVTAGLVVLGVLSTLPLMVGVALLGARRARKTQTTYYAKTYFRRLAPADQEAALDLLDETVTAAEP